MLLTQIFFSISFFILCVRVFRPHVCPVPHVHAVPMELQTVVN